jgi:hypothetical protein
MSGRRPVSMRAVECPCGEHLEANSDESLFEAARRHADEAHPDRYEDWEIRTLVTTSAYDSSG